MFELFLNTGCGRLHNTFILRRGSQQWAGRYDGTGWVYGAVRFSTIEELIHCIEYDEKHE